MSEKPVRDRPRRLADWLNPTGDKKVHSWEDQILRRRHVEVTRLRNAILNRVLCGWGLGLTRTCFTQFARLGLPGLVLLFFLCPSMLLRRRRALVKAGCGKPARPV